MQKPGRPFGVSLAIIASLFVFSLVPLLQIGWLLLVRQRFLNLSLEEGQVQAIAMGGDFLGVPEGSLTISGVIGIGFLIIALFSWRGRPSYMRFLLIAAVVLVTLIRLIGILTWVFAAPDPNAGLSSGQALLDTGAVVELIFSFLVAAYVVWYMNRGPARVFYRGAYLPEPTPNHN